MQTSLKRLGFQFSTRYDMSAKFPRGGVGGGGGGGGANPFSAIRLGCFAFIFFRKSCYCKCSVALPRGAVGWSAVCDCGISCLYSLTFLLCSTQCPF